MYPAWELRRVAAHKAALHKRIALRRISCGLAAAQIVRPLAWLDRVVALWRRLPPLAQLAALPLGFIVQRAVTPRRGVLGALARWGPLVFGAVRGIGALVRTRARPAPSENGQG